MMKRGIIVKNEKGESLFTMGNGVITFPKSK